MKRPGGGHPEAIGREGTPRRSGPPACGASSPGASLPPPVSVCNIAVRPLLTPRFFHSLHLLGLPGAQEKRV
jgi:hypothetical protein